MQVVRVAWSCALLLGMMASLLGCVGNAGGCEVDLGPDIQAALLKKPTGAPGNGACQDDPAWAHLICAAAWAQRAYHLYTDETESSKLHREMVPAASGSEKEPKFNEWGVTALQINHATYEAQTYYRHAASYRFDPPYIELPYSIAWAGGERTIMVCLTVHCTNTEGKSPAHETTKCCVARLAPERVTLYAAVTQGGCSKTRVHPLAILSSRGQIILSFDKAAARLKPASIPFSNILQDSYQSWPLGGEKFYPDCGTVKLKRCEDKSSKQSAKPAD